LFLQCVERYSELNGDLYHESFKKTTTRDVVRSILEGEVELVTRRGTPDGCLMVQGALSTSPHAEKIRQMMAQMRAMAEKWMADRFRKAIDEGDLPSGADPAALACYLMTINSGLAVQAKSGVGKKQPRGIKSACAAGRCCPREAMCPLAVTARRADLRIQRRLRRRDSARTR
jgi:hypothetical protein